MNFFDEKNHQCDGFRGTLNSQMNLLLSQGIGTHKKLAEAITPTKENILWNTGELGLSSPWSLINTVFYYNFKLFGLQGEDEHRNLDLSQIKIGLDEHGSYIKYLARTAKNI